MLKILRNKKIAKKIWIILAVIIMPAFILWGSGSLIRSKQQPAFIGRIFGKKVTFLEYKDALDAVKNQTIIQFGEDFFEKEKQLNLEPLVWHRLILLAEAKKRKVKVSDKEVVELIQSYPFFQRKDRFDKALYYQLLEYVFRTPARVFEEQTRQNLMLAKLYDVVTRDVRLTEEEIKEAYRKENEQVSIYYIASLSSDFDKEITVKEEDLKDYYTQNSFEFKQPLSFNMEYVSSESEEITKNLISNLNKTKNFDEAVKFAGLSIKETGLFGQTEPIPGIGWSPEILNAISKAKAGEFLPPIKMDKYYYILRVKERKEPYIPDFETIKDKVSERFIKVKSKELAKGKIEDCLKNLEGNYQINPKSIDFDSVAKAYGLKSGSTDMFKYDSYIEGIGASDDFWITANKLKEDEFSQIIEVVPTGFYIIKVKSKIPIDEKKFETEKTEFSQKLLLQKKQEYFVKFTEELKRRAQAF